MNKKPVQSDDRRILLQTINDLQEKVRDLTLKNAQYEQRWQELKEQARRRRTGSHPEENKKENVPQNQSTTSSELFQK